MYKLLYSKKAKKAHSSVDISNHTHNNVQFVSFCNVSISSKKYKHVPTALTILNQEKFKSSDSYDDKIW